MALEIHRVVQEPQNAHDPIVADDVDDHVPCCAPGLPDVEPEQPLADVIARQASGRILRDRCEAFFDERTVGSRLLAAPTGAW